MQIRMLTDFYMGVKHGDKDGFTTVPGHAEVVDLPVNLAESLVKSGAACDPTDPYPVIPVVIDLRTRIAGNLPEGTPFIDPKGDEGDEPESQVKRGPGRPRKDDDK